MLAVVSDICESDVTGLAGDGNIRSINALIDFIPITRVSRGTVGPITFLLCKTYYNQCVGKRSILTIRAATSNKLTPSLVNKAENDRQVDSYKCYY